MTNVFEVNFSKSSSFVNHSRALSGDRGERIEERITSTSSTIESPARSSDRTGSSYFLKDVAKNGQRLQPERLWRYRVDVNAKNAIGLTPIFHAAINGQAITILALKALGANINARDEFERTPLHCAAEKGQMEAIQTLTALGADVDAKDKYGWTPIFCSVEKGQDGAILSLKKLGANIHARDVFERTPLHCAAEKGRVSVIKLLVDLGADIEARDGDGKTPLHCAAEKGQIRALKALRDLGADVSSQDKYGQTPLHSASFQGQLSAIAVLKAYGADINAKDHTGQTPLHFVAQFGKIIEIDALISNGADIHAKDKNGWTALHFAASRDQVKAIQFLKTYGADICAKDNKGRTIFHRVIQEGEIKTIEALKHLGADINAKDHDGVTPLHLAAEWGKEVVIEKLIALGADVHAKDQEGRTPLHSAVLHSSKKNIEKLIALGADVNAKDHEGLLPYSFARMFRDLESFEFLIGKADVKVQDGNGMTPLFQALSLGLWKEVDKIKERGGDFQIDSFGQTYLENSVLLKLLFNSLVKIEGLDGFDFFTSYVHLLSAARGFQKYFGVTYLNEILESGVNNFIPSKASHWFFEFSAGGHVIPVLIVDRYLLLFNRGFLRKDSSIDAWSINPELIEQGQNALVRGYTKSAEDFIYHEIPQMLQGEKDAICTLIEEAATHKSQNFGNCAYVGPVLSIIGWTALKNVLASKSQDENDLKSILQESFAEGKIFSDYAKQYTLWLTAKKTLGSSELSQEEKGEIKGWLIQGIEKLREKFSEKGEKAEKEGAEIFYREMLQANDKLELLIRNGKEPSIFNFNEKFTFVP